MTQVERLRTGGLSRFFSDLREGARRQGNVIFALIFRELKTRAGPEGYGYLSLLGIAIEPLMAVLGIAIFFYFLRSTEVSGVPIALFIAVSYTPFMLFRRCITSVPKAVQANRSFYAFQSVKPFDTVLARFIIEAVLTLFGSAVLLFLLWWFLDLYVNTDYLLHAVGLLVAMMGAGFGLALFIGVYGARFPLIFKVIMLGGRAMIILSAVIHPAADLPPQATSIIAWNPLAHFEELLRQYLLGIPPFGDVSLSYFLMFSLTVLFLGFVGYYNNRFKVIEK